MYARSIHQQNTASTTMQICSIVQISPFAEYLSRLQKMQELGVLSLNSTICDTITFTIDSALKSLTFDLV